MVAAIGRGSVGGGKALQERSSSSDELNPLGKSVGATKRKMVVAGIQKERFVDWNMARADDSVLAGNNEQNAVADTQN
jgi:hypothetical protein